MCYQIFSSIIVPVDNANVIAFGGTGDIEKYQISIDCSGVLPLGGGTVSKNGVYLICR